MSEPEIFKVLSDPTRRAILERLAGGEATATDLREGFAITQPVKEGMVLPASPDLLRIMEHVTGAPPVLYPISMQDLTPWDNGVYHSTLLVAPATVCDLPVVGVGLTSAAAPTGYATNVADFYSEMTSLEVRRKSGLRRALDFDLIGTEFHRWVRDHEGRLGLEGRRRLRREGRARRWMMRRVRAWVSCVQA